ncbi:hypothetical protein B0H15DRAFT_429427 [Mycena belliarum]|uniref:Uncharacterized protein n=1 Tax=Mycena belliarum TaxID=1033014 RepID=A0AAD6TXN5_9AGAR|nr:hypothetical protein B0H15DRAFT_429427 [Mycena belliae]
MLLSKILQILWTLTISAHVVYNISPANLASLSKWRDSVVETLRHRYLPHPKRRRHRVLVTNHNGTWGACPNPTFVFLSPGLRLVPRLPAVGDPVISDDNEVVYMLGFLPSCCAHNTCVNHFRPMAQFAPITSSRVRAIIGDTPVAVPSAVAPPRAVSSLDTTLILSGALSIIALVVYVVQQFSSKGQNVQISHTPVLQLVMVQEFEEVAMVLGVVTSAGVLNAGVTDELTLATPPQPAPITPASVAQDGPSFATNSSGVPTTPKSTTPATCYLPQLGTRTRTKPALAKPMESGCIQKKVALPHEVALRAGGDTRTVPIGPAASKLSGPVLKPAGLSNAQAPSKTMKKGGELRTAKENGANPTGRPPSARAAPDAPRPSTAMGLRQPGFAARTLVPRPSTALGFRQPVIASRVVPPAAPTKGALPAVAARAAPPAPPVGAPRGRYIVASKAKGRAP